jgi:broad specificity phosphatase PhoE
MVVYLITCGSKVDGICVDQSNMTLSTSTHEGIMRLKDSWKNSSVIKNNKTYILYTSDTQLAIDSCDLFCDDLFDKDNVELYHESYLRDINFGLWKGLSWQDIYSKWPQDLNNFSKDWFTHKATQGESFGDVIKRVQPFLTQLQEHILKKETVFIFTHPSAIRAMLCCMLELPVDRAYSIRVDYQHVFTLDYDKVNNGFITLCFNSPVFIP